MKNIVIIVVLLLGAYLLKAQPETDLSGTWIAKSGTPDNMGEAFYTFLHEGDSIKASISLPMYGNRFMNMPLPAGTVTADTIRFPTFDGLYNPGKDQIEARVNLMYEAVPYVLERTGSVGKPVLDTACASPVKPEWSYNAGGPLWSSPLLIKDILYFGCDDSCMYALNINRKELSWKFRTHGKVRGEIAVSGNNLVFASDDGNIYCIDKSGRLVWKTAIATISYNRRDPSATDGTWDYAISSPLVSGNRVYAGSTDSCLYALDAGTGDMIWKFRTDHIIRASPEVSGNLVYCGNWGGKLYAVDRNTGIQVWMNDLYQPILSKPVAAGNRILAGSRHTWFWCFDAHTGHEIWKYNYWWSWVESCPAIENNIIYIGSSDLKRILAIDLGTGKTIWKFRTTGYAYATPAFGKSEIYLGSLESSADGPGYLYTLNKKTGELRRKVEIPADKTAFLNGIAGKVAVDKKRLYAATLDGRIMAFGRRTE